MWSEDVILMILNGVKETLYNDTGIYDSGICLWSPNGNLPGSIR
mgnify:FL=1